MTATKKIRLSRIFRSFEERSIIIPIDHGLTLGPIPGIESSRRIGRFITHPRVDALIAHKGMLARLAERNLTAGKGLILHINGMSALAENPDDKEPLTGVEAALRLGAD